MLIAVVYTVLVCASWGGSTEFEKLICVVDPRNGVTILDEMRSNPHLQIFFIMNHKMHIDCVIVFHVHVHGAPI